MDSSKIHQGNEECSSNESGWTMYIASPRGEFEEDEYENEDCSIGSVNESSRSGHKKLVAKEEVDSDDSMASDASSGPPSDLGKNRGGFGHAGEKEDKRKHVGKKDEKMKYDEKIIKAGKDKFGNSAAGRSNKK